MTFGRSIRTCLRKYVVFGGRASRPEYWWFFLFVQLGGAAAGVIDAAILSGDAAGDEAPAGILGALFGLGTLPPLVAAGWRRMHDTGRSGLYLIYPVIVMVGIGTFGGIVTGIPDGRIQDVSGLVLMVALIVFLISPLLVLWWLTRPSDPNPNRYGPPPAEVTT